jgi:hypothetical protein
LFSNFRLSKVSPLIKNKTERIFKELSGKKKTKGSRYFNKLMSFRPKYRQLQAKQAWSPFVTERSSKYCKRKDGTCMLLKCN